MAHMMPQYVDDRKYAKTERIDAYKLRGIFARTEFLRFLPKILYFFEQRICEWKQRRKDGSG